MKKLIYEGKIVNADSDVFEAQVEVNPNTGLIEEVLPLASNKKLGTPFIKFSPDSIIFPGMGDLHVHGREDDTGKHMYKEEYRTLGNAALNGGLVYVGVMPNTPNPLTNEEHLHWHRKRIVEVSHPVTILNYVGIGRNTQPIRGEKVPYKAYTGPSVGDLFFKNKAELEEALQQYPKENISFHVEDYDVLQACKSKKTHSERRPIECVEVALGYLLPMIEKYDIQAKLCHWSVGERSFDMIKEHRESMAKKNLGYNTTIEVSPLHLLFDSDMLAEHPEFWPYVQMNPSIQGREHRLLLIKGLKEGFIQYVATDHAPHDINIDKFKNFARFKEKYPNKSNEGIYRIMLSENPGLCKSICCEDGTSGAPWLDTYSFVVSDLVVNQRFTPQDIARVASYNPGCFVNDFLDDSYGKGFGKIEPGYQGSFTVINFNKPAEVSRDMLQTKCKWSPLEGRVFPGSLEAVIIKGQDLTSRFK